MRILVCPPEFFGVDYVINPWMAGHLGRVIPARFQMPERAEEEEPFTDWFAREGFDVVSLPGEDAFEGEGDALFHPGEPHLWAGYGVRSALETHRTLGETFGAEVVSLRLAEWGFETHVRPVSEFLKAGGGVKCLSLILDQTPYSPITPLPPSPIRASQASSFE